jgi:hypothetical protein
MENERRLDTVFHAGKKFIDNFTFSRWLLHNFPLTVSKSLQPAGLAPDHPGMYQIHPYSFFLSASASRMGGFHCAGLPSRGYSSWEHHLPSLPLYPNLLKRRIKPRFARQGLSQQEDREKRLK